MEHIKNTVIALCFVLLITALPLKGVALEPQSKFDHNVLTWAQQCREEILGQMERLISSGQLREGQLFDTFYIPIPQTSPLKYHTQYDKMADETMRLILDKYLEQDSRLLYVVIVDRNGYLPTHNTRYSQPLTGDSEVDQLNNRAKRMANDHCGLAAAHNMESYLLQSCNMDTGRENIMELSVPIHINGRHWGAVRIGYKK
ncbi:chemotaxis protein [uncultured Desulfuromonas sp.]|uniref:chemotaxis protein n=1 Tax=uncultured Desulfuromonas sp. TaxID=181013 RepID=UPI002AAACC23|nr:chemotaxis protein [uncultured Desulfuromonas sp.]